MNRTTVLLVLGEYHYRYLVLGEYHYRYGGAVRTVHNGPVTGLIAQVLLLAALAGTVGLSRAGWVVGVTCLTFRTSAR
jgi:hypothetical protein